nr:uncharacterized protein LOC105731261 [Aotus nancymaae]
MDVFLRELQWQRSAHSGLKGKVFQESLSPNCLHGNYSNTTTLQKLLIPMDRENHRQEARVQMSGSLPLLPDSSLLQGDPPTHPAETSLPPSTPKSQGAQVLP